MSGAADRLATLLRMHEQEPEDSFCLYGIAQEHLKRGDHDAAIDWFNRTIAVEPDHAYAYFHKAKAQEEADRTDDAVETLRAGLDVAKRCGDEKAANELAAALDLLLP